MCEVCDPHLFWWCSALDSNTNWVFTVSVDITERSAGLRSHVRLCHITDPDPDPGNDSAGINCMYDCEVSLRSFFCSCVLHLPPQEGGDGGGTGSRGSVALSRKSKTKVSLMAINDEWITLALCLPVSGESVQPPIWNWISPLLLLLLSVISRSQSLTVP